MLTGKFPSTQQDAIMAAIIPLTRPDDKPRTVLVRVVPLPYQREGQKIAPVTVLRTRSSPLEHGRRNWKRPIDELQYAAAKVFIADFGTSLGKSNTAAVCETMARLELSKLEAARAHAIAAGALVLTVDGRDESGGNADPENGILNRIARRQAYERMMSSGEIRLLTMFLVDEMTCRQIEDAINIRRGTVPRLVHSALDRLVLTLEHVNKEFADTSCEIREKLRKINEMTEKMAA
jgi:hypothetical protein